MSRFFFLLTLLKLLLAKLYVSCANSWMEAVLGEQLPPAAQLEEGLRNGIYLARLAHIVTPEDVPLNRIYDREQKRYKIAGLQFRHTDNINYWIKSLKSTNLPRVSDEIHSRP